MNRIERGGIEIKGEGDREKGTEPHKLYIFGF